MDIKLKAPYPASALSNLAAHTFVFDGITFFCLEALLQSLKESDAAAQSAFWSLSGKEAWQRGQLLNDTWRSSQTLWWRGVPMARDSAAYQSFLDSIFDTLFTSASFQNALQASGEAPLTHSIGNTDPTQTILTTEEFCVRLIKLRERL